MIQHAADWQDSWFFNTACDTGTMGSERVGGPNRDELNTASKKHNPDAQTQYTEDNTVRLAALDYSKYSMDAN